MPLVTGALDRNSCSKQRWCMMEKGKKGRIREVKGTELFHETGENTDMKESRGQLGRTGMKLFWKRRKETRKQRWRRWFIQKTFEDQSDRGRALLLVSLLASIFLLQLKPIFNILRVLLFVFFTSDLWPSNSPPAIRNREWKKHKGRGMRQKRSFLHLLLGFLQCSHFYLTVLFLFTHRLGSKWILNIDRLLNFNMIISFLCTL